MINESEAETVKAIYYLYVNGWSTKEIADLLTDYQRETKLGNTSKTLAVEKCSYKSSGSHHLPEDTSRDRYELKSMDMVRFIYQTCGWDMKSTYRIRGIAVPERSMVVFDLTTAYRVQEGHLID